MLPAQTRRQTLAMLGRMVAQAALAQPALVQPALAQAALAQHRTTSGQEVGYDPH